MAELFDNGKSDPLVHALASTRRKYTQQERCKRCSGSVNDNEGAYCHRLDLFLEFDAGDVLLTRDGQAITCDGKEWHYREVADG